MPLIPTENVGPGQRVNILQWRRNLGQLLLKKDSNKYLGQPAEKLWHNGLVVSAVAAQVGEYQVLGGSSEHFVAKSMSGQSTFAPQHGSLDGRLLTGVATTQRKRIFQLQLNMVKSAK